MYELVQAGENTYYINCPAKMGIYALDADHVCMIDSGNDSYAAKKALKQIEENGWTLKMIINTHHHADHIGGNQFLQSRTGCRIFANDVEGCFAARPELETAMLYGAAPLETFRHKAYMAKPSMVEKLTEDILPKGLEIIPLPGHSLEQIGIRTDDDIVFLADALLGANILEKYSFSVVVDEEKYLETLERIKAMKGKLFVPSHGEPAEDIEPLAELNIEVTQKIVETVADGLKEPKSLEEITKLLFDRYKTPDNVAQYFLNGTTVKAILTMLEKQGRIEAATKDHRLIFSKIE